MVKVSEESSAPLTGASGLARARSGGGRKGGREAGPGGAGLGFPWLRLYLSLVWLLIGYSSLSYVTALLLRPVFRRLAQPKDAPKKDGTDAS